MLRILSICALALLCATALNGPLRAEDPAPQPHEALEPADATSPTYSISGQIATRVHDDGRLELCFVTGDGRLVCPAARFFRPDRVARDRWISSSEITWQVRLDPELLIIPPTAEPSEEVSEPEVVEYECRPGYEPMLAATWKVATTRARGSAFYIGEGQFLTAHHVIDGVPPFVTLTHGDRAIAAAVLGSDPTVDMALLEVYEPELLADVPTVQLRTPTQDDVGEAVVLVGYPGAGPLTLSLGGVISNVWADEIQTTAAGAGGVSGGPIFDVCGNVLGVIWAGSPFGHFSHSGEALLNALDGLHPAWPALPLFSREGLEVGAGTLVWHFGSEPPADVDCSAVDADVWVGLAGESRRLESLGGLALEHAGQCSYGFTQVHGYQVSTDEPDDATEESGDSTSTTCVESRLTQRDSGEILSEGELGVMLHRSVEEFGTVRLATLEVTTRCPWQFTHQLRVDLATPTHEWRIRPALIDWNGRRLEGGAPGYGTFGVTPSIDEPTGTVFQSWEVPDDFRPVAFEFRIGETTWTVDIRRPELEGPVLSQSARLVAIVERETGLFRVCLQPVDSNRICPAEDPKTLEDEQTEWWLESSALDWLVEVPAEHWPEADAPEQNVGFDCAISAASRLTAWQFTGVGASGGAVYVDDRQFIIAASLVSDELPWGVVAREDAVLPVVLVATDARNGLALVEVIGEDEGAGLGSPVAFGQVSERAAGSSQVLVGYPWGDAQRFTIALGEISDIKSRTFSFPTYGGWYRTGAPVVDPCTDQVMGVSLRSGRVLRAESILESLSTLRRERLAPSIALAGPPLYGSAALRKQPVYVGTKQPDFGGWICNVRESARYEIYYAIYMSRIDGPDLMQVVEGERDWVQRCGWTDKIFIVEYRSDRVPDAICAEPRFPASPLSTRSVEFDAPDGVELLQLSDFRRDPCPGLKEDDYDSWTSDYFVRLRATEKIDIDTLVVEYEDASGEPIVMQSSRYGDIDPDVIAWRLRVAEGGELARMVVSLPEASD